MACRSTASPLYFMLLALALGLCSCGARPAQSPQGSPQDASVDRWFDNSVDPSALGLIGPSFASHQTALQARADYADVIVRCRVITVSTQGTGDTLMYHITLRLEPEMIFGTRPNFDTVTIAIGPENPSYPLVEAKDIQLTGTRFIAMWRYDRTNARASEHDALSMRWHLARDGEDVVRSITTALTLSTIRVSSP